MRVFVTGVCGQLGHDIMLEMEKRGHTAVGSDLSPEYPGGSASEVGRMPYVSMDITDRGQVMKAVGEAKPDVVFHCAAWTAVDAAEDPENIPKVFRINAEGTGNVAEAAAAAGAKLIYISTDYVFDGRGTEPWKPDCTGFAPLNVYGRSKLEGERAAAARIKELFVVRIAWVFGLNGSNFVRTMLRLGETHDTLRVVMDQVGTPTYTKDLARLLADMSETDKYGFYHATNEGGYISWYDFAREIFRQAGMPVKVIPVTTEEYGASKAARPFNSRLDKSKLTMNGFAPLPDWKDALGRYLAERSGDR